MNLYNYIPKNPFSQRHLLSLQDYSSDEILQVISLALKLKKEQRKGISHPILQGKALGMIFSKSSTRTRVSFEVGIHQLGGYGLFLSSTDIQLGRGETIEDTAKVLSRYVDGIMIRTFSQKDVEDLARFATIPIINGLTDLLHPCQILADLMTIYEAKGKLSGLKLAYIGDGNNVFHSLLIGCSKVGMDVSFAGPKGYEPNENIVKLAMENSLSSGSQIYLTKDPETAAKDADIIYTDVWTSMGQEEEKLRRLKVFAPYQVNEPLLAYAKPNAIFLHCLIPSSARLLCILVLA
jgi:ornithine carbamoyltransferase